MALCVFSFQAVVMFFNPTIRFPRLVSSLPFEIKTELFVFPFDPQSKSKLFSGEESEETEQDTNPTSVQMHCRACDLLKTKLPVGGRSEFNDFPLSFSSCLRSLRSEAPCHVPKIRTVSTMEGCGYCRSTRYDFWASKWVRGECGC